MTGKGEEGSWQKAQPLQRPWGRNEAGSLRELTESQYDWSVILSLVSPFHNEDRSLPESKRLAQGHTGSAGGNS